MQLPHRDRPGHPTHDDRQAEDGDRPLRFHRNRQQRRRVGQLVQPRREQVAGHKPHTSQDQRFLGQHEQEVAIGVAHGFEGGVFGEVVGDIGVEDLVDDDDADDETHQDSEAEDEANAGAVRPVGLFDLCPFGGGEDFDIIGEEGREFGFDLLDVGVGVELDETSFHLVGVTIGKHPHESRVTGNDVAIGGERRTDREESRDLQLVTIDLNIEGIGLGQLGGDVAIFGSSGTIEEDFVELLQLLTVLIDFGEVEGLHAGFNAPDEDSAGLERIRIPPLTSSDIDRGDSFDLGVGQGLVETIAGGAFDRKEGLKLRVGDHEFGLEGFVGTHGGVVECTFKTHLDEH